MEQDFIHGAHACVDAYTKKVLTDIGKLAVAEASGGN